MNRNFILILILIFLLPLLSRAQYWGERATEKSFEQSRLYFNSYYLNTFGIGRFGEVAAGLIDDPFLNLYVNPANLPSLPAGNLIYLDFRGDRTEPSILSDFHLTSDVLVDPYFYPDRRWYDVTRREPEPVFSLGFLGYPFQRASQKFFLGASYQLLYKQEKFYTPPSWIYWNRLGYDSFGNRLLEEQYIPMYDRYAGKNEMLNSGHLFSGFAGIQLSEDLSAGMSVNSVIHNREGGYLNLHRDEYGSTNNYDSQYSNELTRSQDYQHVDFAGGVNYSFAPNLKSGIKMGYLQGDADQIYTSQNYSFYQYQIVNVSQEWSYYRNESYTDQSWKQDGKNWYGGFNVTGKTRNDNLINFYYRYTQSDIDVNNASTIRDTALYSSRWLADTSYYQWRNSYSLSDNRTGVGKREVKRHEFMLNSQIRLTEKNNLSLGLYYSHANSNILTTEPVIARASSDYSQSGYYNDEYHYYLFEDKTLQWHHQSTEWSLQIPVLIDFQLNEYWQISLGLNKILRSWNISDETIAYFDTRERLENDSLRIENNFAERYREPAQKITEEYTDLIARFAVKISPRFQVHLLIDPAFDESIRIAHWWLGFQASL